MFLGDVANGRRDRHKFAIKRDSPTSFSDYLRPPLFSPDGTHLASQPELTLRDVTTGEEIHRFDDVIAFTFSPDGKFVAGVRRNGTITLWDPKSGREGQQLLGARQPISSVCFSPDGRSFAAGMFGRSFNRYVPNPSIPQESFVQLWDVASGEELALIQLNAASIDFLTFSPDGSILAAMGDTYDDRIPYLGLHLLDVVTGRQLVRLPGDKETFPGPFAFSPDGRSLVWVEMKSIICSRKSEDLDTGLCRRFMICRWDIGAGKEVRRWPAREPEVSGLFWPTVSQLRFTPDGRTLIAAGASLTMWDADTGEEKPPFSGHNSAIHSIRYSPDGQLLASLDTIGRLCLWNASSGAVRRLPFVAGPHDVLRYRFSSDCKSLVALTPFDVHVWATDGENRSLRHWQLPDPVRTGTFSPDGRLLATIAFEEKGICLWELSTGKLLHRLPGGSSSLEFAPDGSYLTVESPSVPSTLTIWDCVTGKQLARFVADAIKSPLGFRLGRNIPVAFSHNSALLAWGDKEDGFQVWDLADGKEMWRVRGHRCSTFGLAFSSDDKALVTREQWVNTVRLWDVASGEEMCQEELDKKGSYYDPSARTVPGEQFRLLNYSETMFSLPSLRRVLSSPEVNAWLMKDDAFPALSPDGKVVVTKALTFLATSNGRALGRLPCAQHEHVTACLFSPQGTTLATGGPDGTILLWDVRSLHGEWPPQLRTFDTGELQSFWNRFASAKDYEGAFLDLLSSPKQAVLFLAAKLHSLRQPDPTKVAALIADLDSEVFEKRDAATAELAKVGKYAEQALKKALANRPSAELRRRIAELYEVHNLGEASPEMRRAAGAVRVLEMLGTAPARKVLEELTRGPQGAWLTEEAREALLRMKMPRTEP